MSDDLNEEVLKCRFFNRFGRYLNQVKELPLSKPLNLVRICANNGWPVYVLAIMVSGLNQICLWPFQRLHRNSALDYLNKLIDDVIVASARATANSLERFTETRQSLDKCRERIGLESLSPVPNEVDDNSWRFDVVLYELDYESRAGNTEVKHFTMFVDDSDAAPDDDDDEDGPEELHYITLLSVINDIQSHISEFEYTSVEKNSRFIEKYHNLFYALKILEWFRLLTPTLIRPLKYEELLDEAIIKTNERESIAPCDLYQIFYDMNQE